MRIAMLISTPFPPEEGIANYVCNLSNKLVERGHDVVVVSRGGLTAQKTEWDGIQVYKLPFLMAFPFHVDIHGIFVNQFFRELEKSLDLIHVHTPLTPALSTRTRIVTTFHTPHFIDSLETEPTDSRLLLMKILGILAYRIEKSLISSSRVISAVSNGVAIDLQRYDGVRPGKIAVLGNAVSDEFLEAGRGATEKDDNMILYTGRLEQRKGVLDLVTCMKTVSKNMPKARLVMIGKGPLLHNLMRKVADLGLQKHVEVRGFVSRQELLETSLHASVFVLPSHYEGLPTVALEAMACQTAIVGTAVRGNLDILKHGDTAIVVPPKAPESLACAIINLLQHPELRQRIAKNARRMVEEHFTWDKVTERTLTMYAAAQGD